MKTFLSFTLFFLPAWIMVSAGEKLRIVEDGAPKSIIILPEKSAPFQTVDLHFAEGTTVSGRVAFPDGSSVFGANVKLDFEIRGIGGFSNEGTTTNSTGDFQFKHVDLDNGGSYTLVNGGEDYEMVDDATTVTKNNSKARLLTVKKCG